MPPSTSSRPKVLLSTSGLGSEVGLGWKDAAAVGKFLAVAGI